MSDMGGNNNSSCQLMTWALAAVIGFLAFVLLLTLGDYRFISAVFLSIVIFGLLGLVMSWLFCGALAPAAKPGSAPTVSGAPPSSATSADASASGSGAATAAAAAAGATTAAGGAALAESAASDGAEHAAADVADVSSDPPVTDDVAVVADTAVSDAADDGAQSAADVSATSSAASVAATTALEGTVAAGPSAGQSGSVVKASPVLEGQSDLASRKGSWRYDGNGQPAETASAAPVAKSASTAAPEPAASAPEGVDYDKDGVIEGKDEGAKPQLLDAPREGGADNLKEVKGIGPKLEKLCFSMGVYHFDQIAAWTADEIAWVDANLEGFKGRVSRDKWVEQAKILAAGGETEFSKKVDKGGVY